jgi:hypothetical protein
VAEAKDRSLLVLDVVRGGRVDVRMAQHLMRGRDSKAAVDLRAVFLSQGVQRRSRDDVVRAQPCEQRADLSPAAVVVVGCCGASGSGRAVALDDELALSPRVKAAEDLDEFSVERARRPRCCATWL